MVSLNVNGKSYQADVDPRTPLLWVLRDAIGLTGTVWVASSFNSRSFDSRYFGPISESAIKHRLVPIWTE